MNENQLSYQIIGAALEIHKAVGPGLLESAYENAMVFELKKAGLSNNSNGCNLASKEFKLCLVFIYPDTQNSNRSPEWIWHPFLLYCWWWETPW